MVSQIEDLFFLAENVISSDENLFHLYKEKWLEPNQLMSCEEYQPYLDSCKMFKEEHHHSLIH